MKVIVTGATGRLGRTTCRVLAEKGFDVTGLDKSLPREPHCPVKVADLTHRELCYSALEGVETLVHLANIPNASKGDAQMVFNSNVTVNMNVFQAAWEHGVKKIIFASSIQTMFNERTNDFEKPQSQVPWLPVDGSTPPLSQNPYSLSKTVGELQLEYFSRMAGIEAVALRFPALVRQRRRNRVFSAAHPASSQAFALLFMEDAARLIAACLSSSLPGFRVYVPACADLVQEAGGLEEVLKTYYADTPRKKEPLDCVVDISLITKETGWIPMESIKEVMENPG